MRSTCIMALAVALVAMLSLAGFAEASEVTATARTLPGSYNRRLQGFFDLPTFKKQQQQPAMIPKKQIPIPKFPLIKKQPFFKKQVQVPPSPVPVAAVSGAVGR